MNVDKYIALMPKWQTLLSFFISLYRRIKEEQIHVVAGYLSYVSLMSLVPLLVVMLSVMTAFPLFAELKQVIENFIYNNFLPTTGDVVQQYIAGFVENASKMSAIAVSFLFIMALLLISAIDKSLNKIWHVKEKRRVVTAFSMYWMVLTLGPIFVGSSLAASSYIVSLVSFNAAGVEATVNLFLRLLPILSSLVAFIILYMVVPNKTVPLKFALSGAILAALLFELAKRGFVIYVTQLPSYQAIYGAFATIPIVFLWVYLSWLVVLVGAVFTVSLQAFSEQKNEDKKIETVEEKEPILD